MQGDTEHPYNNDATCTSLWDSHQKIVWEKMQDWFDSIGNLSPTMWL